MKNKRWPTHLFAIDISRSIAALAVVIWHWQHFAHKSLLIEEQPLYNVLRLFYEKGSLGVSYFFILSGFIFFWLYKSDITDKKINAWNFSIQRFSRLYPLHLATLLIVAILQILYVSRESSPFIYANNDSYHFLLNLLFASNWVFEKGWSFNAPIWSVSIEILLYISFFLMCLVRLGGWFLCLTLSITAFILSYTIQHSLINGLAMFYLGGLVFHSTAYISKTSRIFKMPTYLIAIFSWTLVITHYYFLNLNNDFMGVFLSTEVFIDVYVKYILFPFTIASLALIEIDRGPILESFSWLGNITYSSYLLHFPLQLIFILAVSYGILNSDFYLNTTYLLIYFIILILLSYFTYVKFERPAQKFIRNQLLKNA